MPRHPGLCVEQFVGRANHVPTTRHVAETETDRGRISASVTCRNNGYRSPRPTYLASSTQGGDNARCTRIVLPWATVFNAFSVPVASHSLADHTEMCGPRARCHRLRWTRPAAKRRWSNKGQLQKAQFGVRLIQVQVGQVFGSRSQKTE